MHRPAARMMFSKTPSRTQVWNHRCTVLLEPNRRGRSFHFAPLSSIQKIPRSTLLLFTGGRPPRGLLGDSGIRSINQFNCSSVSFNAMHDHMWKELGQMFWLPNCYYVLFENFNKHYFTI